MGLESRSGQGFSRPAVATVITASGIVTLWNLRSCDTLCVATVITASGIVTSRYSLLDGNNLRVATVITASGIVTAP